MSSTVVTQKQKVFSLFWCWRKHPVFHKMWCWLQVLLSSLIWSSVTFRNWENGLEFLSWTCLACQMPFPVKMTIYFSSIIVLIWIIVLAGFPVLTWPFLFLYNSHLVMLESLLIYLWIQFANAFYDFMSVRGSSLLVISYSFLFCFICYCCSGITGFTEWIENVLSLFWEDWVEFMLF